MDFIDFSDKLAHHLIDNAKDELDIVLRGFLVAEFYVNDFLEAKLPNGKVISESRLNFSTKLKIIESLDPKNLLTEYIEQLRKFSEVRNKFAHNLDYKLQTDDLEKLYRSIGTEIQQLAEDKKERLRFTIMQILTNTFTSFSVNKITTESSLADKAKLLREKKQ